MAACKIDKHLGARISMAREENGVQLKKLACAMGVTDRELSAIEQGQMRVSAVVLARAAINLDRTIGWFYEGLPGQLVFEQGSK